MVELARLLRPKSIAVLGGAWAREVIRQLQKSGYHGAIWPVHPEKALVEGLPAFASLAALPYAPDAAFIGVNRHDTIEIVRQLAAQGAGGAVCFASGFAESGAEGRALQADLIAAAGDMPLLGPNCYGFINAFDGALLWPDVHGTVPVKSGVAFITQSSNIAINLTMARRALPIGYVLCLGNQAVVGLAAAIEGLAQDPRVSVIGLHIEAISDPAAFAKAVAFAKAKGKALIALRTGRSIQAQAMVMSHTASLAGGAAVAQAFLRRIGVVELDTVPEFLEAAKLLHVLGPLGESGLVSLSCSGGEASLVVDCAQAAGVKLAEFSPARLAAIRATVNPLVSVSNPFDYHTFDWGNAARLAETFRAVMQSGQAVTALVLDFPKAETGSIEGWDIALEAFAEAARETGAKAIVVATVPECLPEDRAKRLINFGVAPLNGLAEMMAAVRAAIELGKNSAPFRPLPASAAIGELVLLDEAEGKALLQAHGVSVPEGVLCTSQAEMRVAVARFDPAAAKAIGADIAHKTELGAVKLGLKTQAEADAAFAQLSQISPAILVERMVQEPIAELIIGAARDAALGLHLVIGAGGVLAELIADTQILMLPTSKQEIRAALARLKIKRLLDGWRGKPAANMEKLEQAIFNIAAFVGAQADTLEELDINPLIVTPSQAVAADVLIRLRGKS